MPLNVAEASRRTGKDRLHLFRIALGSAEPLGLVDRVRAMTYRLSRR